MATVLDYLCNWK